MRGPLATLAATLAVGLAVGLIVPRVTAAPLPAPEAPPPADAPDPPPSPETARAVTPPAPEDGRPTPSAPEDGPPTPPAEDPEAALLRERLGGLAALVLPADELVEACARPAVALPEVADAPGVDDVVAATEALRGLRLEEPVHVRLLAPEEMVAEVEERFAGRGDPERVDLEERILTALGAIDADTDLAELRVGAFAEQVSGLHAGDDGLVLLRVDDPGARDRDDLDPLARVVLAHEVEHALTYQHLGRPAEHRDDGEHADARRASLAVVEGSATALMLQYARAVLDADERSDLRAALVERAEEGALAGYTPYLIAELQFPYTHGLRFACARLVEGGWEAVDATYTKPPSSSAEVLFPERYGEEARAPGALGELAEPWERARTTTLGAAELLWLVSAPGGDAGAALEAPHERAGAWDGGRLVLWTRGEDSATAIGLVERDDDEDRPPLCVTVRDWYARAFPDAVAATDDDVLSFAGAQQDAALACGDGEVRLGIAPTAEEAATLVR